MIAFGYYGAKNYHLDWLLPLLPNDDTVEHYLEPFCGSCAVLLNRAPSKCETINDLSERVTNFFRVLRTQKHRLIRSIRFTPYSADEYALSMETSDDPVEEARRFIVQLKMGMFSVGGRPRGNQRLRLSLKHQWSSPPNQFQSAPRHWVQVADRLVTVQIPESQDGISLIEKCDAHGLLVYADPPYLMRVRNADRVYKHEMSDAGHRRLIDVASQMKGRIAISGYESSFYDDHFKKLGWIRHRQVVPSKIGAMKGERVEILWCNYQIADSEWRADRGRFIQDEDLFGGLETVGGQAIIEQLKKENREE